MYPQPYNICSCNLAVQELRNPKSTKMKNMNTKHEDFTMLPSLV